MRTGDQEGTSAERPLSRVGTYDPDWQVNGFPVAYTDLQTASEIVGAREGMDGEAYLAQEGADSALVLAQDEDAVPGVVRELREAGFAASPLSDRLGDLPGVFSLLPYVAAAVGGLGVLLLSLAAHAATTGGVRQQLHDLALLRVNGWSVADVRRLLLAETALAVGLSALVGMALAVVLGPLLLRPTVSAAGLTPGGSYVQDAGWVAAAGLPVLLLAVATATAASWVAARRSLRIDPYLAVQEAAR